MPEMEQPSKRSIANRENGRKGGLAAAQSHDQEWLQRRAVKGGSITRDLYSSDFFRYINSQRKTRRGWPKGKLRKAVEEAKIAVAEAGLSPAAVSVLNQMLVVTR